MTKSDNLNSIKLNLGTRLHKELAEEAEKNGVSLNEYILDTVYRRIIEKEILAKFEKEINKQIQSNTTLVNAISLSAKLITYLEKEIEKIND